MKSRFDILAYWEGQFIEARVDSPRLSAQVLLAHVLDLPRLEMLLDIRTAVPEHQIRKMVSLALRRMQGEPVAYLVGVKEFYGLDFHVNPAVLIPRPETELMVDHLAATIERMAVRTLLDVGTGSGALAVTCAVNFPRFRVLGVDISAAALDVAKRNANVHGVGSRVMFAQGDVLDAVRVDGCDIILANLPYVPTSSRDTMSHEVLDYEPDVALFAGADGLSAYRRLAACLKGRAVPGSLLLCEIDHSQGQAMSDLFSPIAKDVHVERDLSGLDRMVVVVF
jgi:release factor glutamine methyltransferase